MVGRRLTLVEQVRVQLLDDLSNGRYAAGDQLPNEQEMSENFSVSRATIRDVYRSLIESGYLIRRHGTGTFVSRIPTRHALESTLSYTDMITAAGFTPGIRLIATSVRHADPDEQDALQLAPGDQVIAVRRVRTADGKPVVYSFDRIPVGVLSPTDESVAAGSLFRALESVGAGPRTAWARLTPVLAEPDVADALGVDVGSPLLHIEETDYDGGGRAVMQSAEWHVSDTFELWLNRRAQSPGS